MYEKPNQWTLLKIMSIHKGKKKKTKKKPKKKKKNSVARPTLKLGPDAKLFTFLNEKTKQKQK